MTTTDARPTYEKRGVIRRAAMEQLTKTPPSRSADALATMAMSKRALTAALTISCPRGHARGGDPCWALPAGRTGANDHIGLCGERVYATFKRWRPPTAAAGELSAVRKQRYTFQNGQKRSAS